MAKKNDDLVGTSGADLMRGHRGADTLDGRGGSDALYGGKGSDTLIGGAGVDFLHGGKGADRFYLASAGDIDSIADFDPGKDTIVIEAGLSTLGPGGGPIEVDAADFGTLVAVDSGLIYYDGTPVGVVAKGLVLGADDFLLG